ncbi:hypothetical protein SARC_10994, partial [Sphaeroforma arctica JP610]
LALQRSIQTLSKDKPYHLLYMTHFGNGKEMAKMYYNEPKHTEVFEKFAYKDRPMGTFPAALSDIEEDVLCFKSLHFQYDESLTELLKSTSNVQKGDPLKKDGRYIYKTANTRILQQLAPLYVVVSVAVRDVHK